MNGESENVRQSLRDSNRVVIKVGTNSLTDQNSKLDESRVEKLVENLMYLMNDGKEIILVSSGAIGAGIGRLSLDKRPEDMESLQAASTIGQGELMRKYSEAFERHGLKVAQLLLTREDFTDPNRFDNFKNTIKVLFEWGVVPIINENDAVAVEEIRMGDNDLLSAFTASGINSDLLIMLTDVDGLCAGDPKKEKSVEPIKTVEEVDSGIEELTRKSTNGDFGGMYTKVQAAKIATEDGIPVVIANAGEENILNRIIEGEEIGTLFIPREKETTPEKEFKPPETGNRGI